ARIGAVAPEGHGKGRRRDHAAPRAGRPDRIIYIEGVGVADGPGEVLEGTPFDGDRKGWILLADDRLVDDDRHQAPPFDMARSRNFPMSRTRKRSCLPSAILSLSSHASTAKTNRLPSVSSSVALALTFMPTGVGARCRISTFVPTVLAPGGR